MTGWTSPTHLVLLLLIALLLFGAKKLPEIGRSLGHGMREFKDSVSGESNEHTTPTTPTTPAELPPAAETAVTTAVHELERERETV